MKKKKPNVVFILSDDHGQWAMGCYGNEEIKTPNLDKIADEGMLFDNFYCASPVCSPARASILTGKMPSQHGVHDWIGSGCVKKEDYENIMVSKKRYVASLGDRATEDYHNIDEKEKVSFKEISQWKFVSHETDAPIEYLKDDKTYTELLSENGYKCGIVGKWHLGASATPQKGYSYWSVIGKGGCLYHLPDFYRDGKLEVDDTYITDTITDEGIGFIEDCAKKDQPFYINLNYTAPHSPWVKEDQDEEIWNSYNDCPFESVKDEGIHPNQVDRRHPGFRNPEKRKYMLQAYYTAVTAMDNNIGRLLDKLVELGIRDDTMIIFTGDNGMNLGQHGIWGKGNGTFPMNFYDSSIKVPTLISQPSRIKEGVVNSDMLSHYDFFPTILNWCGIDNRNDGTFPGQDFSGILKGENQLEEKPLVIFDEYGPNRMIRSNQYKYIHRYPYGECELYDMEKDPNETVNLYRNEKYKDIIESLNEKLISWFNIYSKKGVDGLGLGVNGNGQFGEVNIKSKGKNPFKDF